MIDEAKSLRVQLATALNDAETAQDWANKCERRADAAESALAAARRECEQAESERDAASEVLRDALAWEAETRGRLGLPQIDAPMWAQIARAALAAPGDGDSK